ncbi:MAG: choice-of-anchor L domain-containing protein [Flavobacteriales bacterium]
MNHSFLHGVNQEKLKPVYFFKHSSFALIVLVASFFSCIQSNAQLVVQSDITVAQMVQQMMGQGAQAFNITFNGQPAEVAYAASAGSFQCSNCNIGLSSGLAMSTGRAYDLIGPNDSGSQSTYGVTSNGDADTDMWTLVSSNGGNEVNDLSIIEFDYIPYSDSIQFEFVWGSEEYDSYVSSSYNDVFGIFVSGPGIAGPFQNNAINLAVIPGTDIPVSVNSINNGNSLEGPCNYCEYYNQEISDGELWGLIAGGYDAYILDINNIQLDGYTDIIASAIEVSCGETYHVKIAICDASDNSMDSGVFIKGGTLSSDYASIASLQFDVDGPNNNIVYEQCGEGAVRIQRPVASNNQESLTCYLDWSGSALEGTDYSVMPDSIVFNPDQSYVDIPFEAFSDTMVEFVDTVLLSMMVPASCSGSGAYSNFTFYISDVIYPFIVQGFTVDICPGDVFVEPIVQGGFGNYTYLWNDGSTEPSFSANLIDTTHYTVTIGDTCGLQPITVNLTYNVFQFDPLTVSLEDTYDILPFECGENGSIYAYGEGGVPDLSYYFTASNNSWVSSNFNSASITVANAGDLYVRVVDACGYTATDTLNVTVNVAPLVVELPDTVAAMCGQSVFVESTVTGGNTASDYWYSWYLDGNYQNNWQASNVYWSFYQNSQVVVTSSDDCGQWDTDTTQIMLIGYDPALVASDSLIALCESLYGCLDVTACNYDSLALWDDGSCYQPAILTINGPLTTIDNETPEYWVSDYYPGAELNWIVDSGTILSESDSACVLEWWGSGSASLCVYETLGESCMSDTVCVEIDIIGNVDYSTSLGIVSVYPNPAKDMLWVTMERHTTADWCILTMDGRLVQEGTSTGKQFNVNTESLASGSYILRLETEEQQLVYTHFVKLF